MFRRFEFLPVNNRMPAPEAGILSATLATTKQSQSSLSTNAPKDHAAALQKPENSTKCMILANSQISATFRLFYTAELLVFPITSGSLGKTGETGSPCSRQNRSNRRFSC
jgi:hypothetical protein